MGFTGLDHHTAMASVASERIPIATLHPSLPAPATKSITAVVTILWPYSSSTRTCALLLADPDFRLRRRRGQVRAQFFGDAAYAVAKSQLGIGDKVVLKLGGVQWLQSSGEEEVVRTPGKSVDWEVGFRDRLAMLVTRDGKQFANIQVERSTPEPEEVEEEEEALFNTPSKIVGRFSAEGLRFNTWSSPAFLRHGRLSGESFSDYDIFADEDESKSRKRRRTSFKNIGVWTYAARTPSPEKGDAISVDEDGLASPSERVSAFEPPAPALPETPDSATNTLEEPEADEGEVLVPESFPSEHTPLMAEHSRARPVEKGHMRESLKEQDDTLYEQYLEETHEGQEEDTEIDVFPGEPEDEPAAQFSLQDAEDIQGDSDAESLPSVVTDTDVAAPSAAASIRIEESAGDTELESDDDGIEVLETSFTQVIPGEQEVEHWENEGLEARRDNRAQAAPIRLSSTEEDTSEDEQLMERPPSERKSGQPMGSNTMKQLIGPGRDVAESHEHLERPASDATQDFKMQLEKLEDRATLSGLVRGKQGESTDLRSADIEHQPAGVSGAAPSSSLAAVPAAPTMPPPVLLLPQSDDRTSKSPAGTPLIGPVNAPSTPQLQPVTSTALPLPSPFPSATEASSYMDAHPSSLPEQASTLADAGLEKQEDHVIRPATAISVAQASQEALEAVSSEPEEPRADQVAQMLDQAPNVPQEEPKLTIREETLHYFGLDGSVLSAVRAPRRGSREKAESVESQQETQSDHSVIGLPVEADTPDSPRRSIAPDSEQATKHMHDVAQSTVHEDLRTSGPQDSVAEEHGSLMLETEKHVPGEGLDIHPSGTELPANEDTPLPAFEDDDWDMPDAAAATPSEAASTPRARNEGKANEGTPISTPQKRMRDPSTLQAGKPPASSAVEIVDLGSDSSEEEERSSTDVSAEAQMISPIVRQKPSADQEQATGTDALPKDLQLARPAPQVEAPPLTQANLSSSLGPPSTPQTRRKTRQHTQESASQHRETRQSTVDTVSLADTSAPSTSQKRSLRSSQTSRTPHASQGASGVAARVAQRRRRTEVKDSECEWDSNASISTQRPSSPSIPSGSAAPEEFEPSAGLEPSQILGDVSQMEQQTREESLERPPVSPITPVALESTLEASPHASQGSVEDHQEAQNLRLQKELEGDSDEDLFADRSSSPFPELNFEWGTKKKDGQGERQHSSQEVFEPEAQSKQSSVLRDEFDKAGPIHSSMLQDDSSIIHAMRTSQFPFETLREEQITQSVGDDESQQTVRARSPPEQEEVVQESQVEDVAAPPNNHIEQSRITDDTLDTSQTPVVQHEHLEALRSSPPIEAALDSARLAGRPQPLQESSIITPEASQYSTEASWKPSQLQPDAQKAHDSHFPPTPRLTQATRTTSSTSQATDTPTVAQLDVKQRLDDAATQDTAMTDDVVALSHPLKSADTQTVVQPSVKQQQDYITSQDTVMTNDVAEISRSPKLTDDTTLIEPSQSQKSDAVAMTQSPKPADDTTLVEPSQSSLQTAVAIKQTSPPPRHSFPSQQQLQESLSQGTRTSYSYFTSLANLRSYINSPSQLVDILAVCTRPNKPPVRAAAGPRDYHTIFSITDASLLDLGDGNGGEGANDKTVRVQVFRPWKAALPELDVGDAVLLRGFAVKSSKKGAMLVSGEESAWCVFRYRGGPPAQSEPAVPDDKNEAANGRSGEREQEESKNEKRKSTIMDSTRPIWADVMSGLWGAVAPSGQEEQEVDQPQQQQKGSSEEREGMDVDGPKNGGEKEAMTSRRNRHHHRHYNPVSGASKEEVHGPPVEYGDEERRRAWEMREWWVSGGGGDGAAVAAIAGREDVKVEEEAEKSGNVRGEPGRKEGESESVVAVEENGEAEEERGKQKNSARDHFRSFL
ncbi:hypothetical protein SLS55_006505 [Diplodia seriata]|uniref:Telomeric single stranded DNA binding POT1/Cdc13 domain-containing protein n=1 Tax=Diplodia seriata TaxID=420778 RepID=A0ABR3CED4_9PEZI